MIVFAELIVALAWTFGPNGFLIERQLDASEALPWAWVTPVAEKAWVVFHDREEWPMAFYVPPAPEGLGSGEGAENSERVPRVVLFAPYYLAPDGLVAASRMPVDVAEYYFHALLEASFDLGAGSAAYAAWAETRAAELMSEVPAAQRPSAYREALSDFGAHLLSIVNEVSRAAERQAAAGRNVCRHLDQPASLFGLWRRSLAAGSYAGGYFSSDGDDGPPRWVQGRQALERSDKDRFLAELFGVGWSGDPRSDFEALCHPEELSSPSC